MAGAVHPLNERDLMRIPMRFAEIRELRATTPTPQRMHLGVTHSDKTGSATSRHDSQRGGQGSGSACAIMDITPKFTLNGIRNKRPIDNKIKSPCSTIGSNVAQYALVHIDNDFTTT